MTERVHSFVVVLDHDMRTDDVEATLGALRQIKNVISVKPNVSTSESLMAEDRARFDLGKKVIDAVVGAVYPERKR